MRSFLFHSFALVSFTFLLSGCAYQRAEEAQEAKGKLVGMNKEQVFTCMGIPKKKAKEGETEIWSYKSGNGYAIKNKSSTSTGLSRNWNAGLSFGHETRENRYCKVEIVMKENIVINVLYSGPTGGFFTEDEQCAYAVRNCL
jgi:hypothetical protein